MMRRRPRIAPSDIERQTHGFAEGPFVIFENLRTRKMSHDLLVGRSGCASFARYTLRSGMSNSACLSHRRAHTKMRAVSATVAPIEVAVRRRCRRESAVEDQGTASCPQRANAEKAHCGVLKFCGARGKARRFA